MLTPNPHNDSLPHLIATTRKEQLKMYDLNKLDKVIKMDEEQKQYDEHKKLYPQNPFDELTDKQAIQVQAKVKPACEQCKWMEKQLKKVIAYPTKAQGRRTKDGYPQEFFYDEFAYKRLVDSFRQALKDILKDSKSV